ncbi:MAG: type II secretion system protein N [Desulfobacterales bacterium]
MGRAKTTRKAAIRISKRAEGRIVELSLQNPEFGARRLASLLKEIEITVSASAVYTILKRNGLQTREKRMTSLNDKVLKAASVRNKFANDISLADEKRIVDISLQNPDFGAKRLLPLLNESGIEASTSKIYNILKGRGIQTRKLRLAKIDELCATEGDPAPEKAPAKFSPRHSQINLRRLAESFLPAVKTAASYTVPIPETPEEPEEIPEDTNKVLETPPAARAPSGPVKSPQGTRRFFYLADLCLLVLIGYLGYLAVFNFKQFRLQPVAIVAVKPVPTSRTEQPEITVQPLKGYRKIWERNLFNISEKKPPAQKKEIPIEKLALAEKDIGLKLVGTVVANDATLSCAILHVLKTREQDAYREGDEAGKVKIKKILRNKVVITTTKGDQLLIVKDEDFGKGGRASFEQRRVPMNMTSQQPNEWGQKSGNTPYRTRTRSINRDEVEATLADTDQLLQKLSLSPFMQEDKPSGFIISNIPRGSVLKKMGLRNGYVVTGVNDQDITSPDQATEFFRTLAEGGEMTIQVRSSRGSRHRSRQIILNIE